MQELQQFLEMIYANQGLFIALTVWTLVAKGVALWTAGTRKHLWWFVIILLLNTFGLVELLYLLYLHRFDLGGDSILKKLPKAKTAK